MRSVLILHETKHFYNKKSLIFAKKLGLRQILWYDNANTIRFTGPERRNSMRPFRFCLALCVLLACLSGCADEIPTEPTEQTLPPSPYAAEDFAVGSPFVQYTGEKTAYVGIDVSTHQGEIDWEAVAASGVQFAMIRIGYRGYTEGGISVDDTFERNITQAQQAGIETGVYFFSQATSVAEAEEEARFVCDQLEGYTLTYPVVFDWERMADTRSAEVPYATVTECAKAFCSLVEDNGRRAGVYFNLEMSKFMDFRALQNYVLWLAEYNDYPTYSYAFDCWQYSTTGQVDGIGVNTDLNLYFE